MHLGPAHAGLLPPLGLWGEGAHFPASGLRAFCSLRLECSSTPCLASRRRECVTSSVKAPRFTQ